jgi:dihydrofolate reductase
MGKLVVNTFTTLDGVMQAPGMPEEDREGGFDQGGWQVPYFDEESGQVMAEGMASFDALLLGRKTYEIFASYWPNAPADDPMAERLNKVPKYVASRTLANVMWENSTCSRAISKMRSRGSRRHTTRSTPPEAGTSCRA